MLAYLTHWVTPKNRAQQSFEEALGHTMVSRDMLLDLQASTAPATDVFVRYLTEGPAEKMLRRAEVLVDRIDNARPLALCAVDVRQSLTQALAQSSPSFVSALAFVQAAQDPDVTAHSLLGAQTRHRPISLQAHAQELLLVWQERMLDERAALRYAQAVPEPMLQTLSGPVGVHFANFVRKMRRYGPTLLEPVQPKSRPWPALTRQQYKRLQEIDHCLRLCRMQPLPKALVHKENLVASSPDAVQAQHRTLAVCQSIDITLLRRVFRTRDAARFVQVSPSLEQARQKDIASAVREAQIQLGPHTIEAQLGGLRQISSATLSANASISTGLRK